MSGYETVRRLRALSEEVIRCATVCYLLRKSLSLDDTLTPDKKTEKQRELEDYHIAYVQRLSEFTNLLREFER